MEQTIKTTICPECKYGEWRDKNPRCAKVKCNLKEKEYPYGMRIPCENYEKKIDN